MEYFDTGNDPRLKFVNNFFEESMKILKSKKIPGIKRDKLDAILGDISKALQQILWSYLPKDSLVNSEPFKMLEEKLEELEEIYNSAKDEIRKRDESTSSLLEFLISNLKNLKTRILDYPDEPSSAVDYFYVKVITKEKHPKTEKLYITFVTNGQKNFRVITNLEEVKPGDVIPMALLPPREFSGVISEGMFIAPEMKTKDESLIGNKPDLSEKEKKYIVKEIYKYIQ